MVGTGFEPVKAMLLHLKCNPFDLSGNLPMYVGKNNLIAMLHRVSVYNGLSLNSFHW